MRGRRSGQESLEVAGTIATAEDVTFERGEKRGCMDGRHGEWVEMELFVCI